MEDIGTKTTPINNYLESLTSSINPSSSSSIDAAYLRMPSSSSSRSSGLFSTDTSSTSESSFFNISWMSIIVIVLLLAFLGFNIFIYLAKGTQGFVDIFSYFAKMFDFTTSQAVIGTAKGTQVLAGQVQQSVEQSQSDNLKQVIQQPPPQQKKVTHEYVEDDAQSNIQMGSGKSGWCYIGEDRGFRTCASVKETDKCMSGDIFPSHEICVNPTLRT